MTASDYADITGHNEKCLWRELKRVYLLKGLFFSYVSKNLPTPAI